MVDAITAYPEGTRLQVLSPVVRARKGEHAKVLEDARRSGYVRVRADGNLYDCLLYTSGPPGGPSSKSAPTSGPVWRI